MFNFYLSLFKKSTTGLRKVQRIVAKIHNMVDAILTRNKYIEQDLKSKTTQQGERL